MRKPLDTAPTERKARVHAAPLPPARGVRPTQHAEPLPMHDVRTSARQRARAKRARRLAWIAAGLLVLAAIIWSLWPEPLTVDVAPVAYAPLEVTIDAEGTTRVRDLFEVAAPVTGQLERMTLRAGDAVAAGMVLARITPTPLDPQTLAEAEARLAAAAARREEANAHAAQTRDAMAQEDRTAARMRAIAAEGAMSAEALERVELGLAAARSAHDAAAAQATAADAEVAAARAALLGAAGHAPVTAVSAPTDGRVLRVYEENMRVVQVGTPLLAIGDAVGLEVRIDVLSEEAVRIRAGAPVRLHDWGGTGELEARVRLVEPQAFSRVSTLGVEEQRVYVLADLAAPPAGLGDGYRVQARIVVWAADSVLQVPVSALFRAREEWQVYVVQRGRAVARAASIGQRGAAAVQILEGLRPGEQVILFPSDRITAGVRVRTPAG